MAIIEVNFISKCLMRTVTFNAIIPVDKFGPQAENAEQKPLKTLYLLHGIFGNYTDWVNGTRIQAWAEAMEIYRSGDYPMTFSPEMEDHVKLLQREFMPEDTQTGMIQAFLDSYEEDYVCSTIIYQQVFHQEGIVPKWQSKEIGDLMDNEIIGWTKHGNHRFGGVIGTQRSWKRVQPKKR